MLDLYMPLGPLLVIGLIVGILVCIPAYLYGRKEDRKRNSGK